MRIEGNKIIFEMRPCTGCNGTKERPAQDPCPRCHGTGNGPKGGARGCRQCHGFRTVISSTRLEPCTWCNATGKQAENNCDAMPEQFWQGLNFRVYRQDRDETYNEHFLAHGCVYSCTDYGSATKQTDAEIIAKVREQTFVQAVKVIDREDRFCNHVGIFVNRSGYSVRAVFSQDGEDARTIIALERGLEEGLQVGTAIARAGGNGTYGAIYR